MLPEYTMEGNQQPVSVRVHMPYQAATIPRTHLFSMGQKDKKALKRHLTQATLHDKGAEESARGLDFQGNSTVQQALTVQPRLHSPAENVGLRALAVVVQHGLPLQRRLHRPISSSWEI
jgi:hypothetical protein